MELLSQGAEAKLYVAAGKVHKQRTAKTYRHPLLDKKLRASRTRKELKVLGRLKELDIPVPETFDSTDGTTIVMQHLVGVKLRDELLKTQDATLLKTLGKLIAKMHEHGITHGDLITSNCMVTEQGLVLIDFGLSQFTQKVEDFAVDLHVLEETLESTHPQHHKDFFAAFLTGYDFFDQSETVQKRLEVVRGRGRNK